MTATAPARQRPPVAASTASSSLTGTRRLLRLAARRDRVLLTAWVVVLTGLMLASVASIAGLYGDEASRVQYAVTVAPSVVARAFEGPIMGTSLGAVVITETFGLFAVLVGLMSVQAVVRHTRLEEETGRAELVGSAVVGRHAPLTSALLLTFAANLAVGAGTAVVMLAYDLPLAGAVLTGLLLVGVGMGFAGVGAITAQVAGSARGANGLGGAVLGLAYLLRALGDALGTVAPSGVAVDGAWPVWLSPIGWGHQARPFEGDRWWVVVLHVALVVVTVAVAFVLTRHRDVGAGLRPVRPGPATAARWLRSPLGLAWRLHRGAVLGWLVGLGLVAVVFGAIGEEVDAFLETSDELAELFAQLVDAGTLVDLYLVFMMALLAVAVGGFAVQGLLRLRQEELTGRAEPVLATAVARHRWLVSHLVVVVGAAVVLLLMIGLVGGTAYGLATGEWGRRFADWVVAALVGLPAVLALAGVVVAAIGLTPRWAAAIAWSALGASLVMGQLGALLDLPQWVLNLSPFTHMPAVPAEPLRWLPLLLLMGVAVASTAIGLAALRRRDVGG